MSVYMHVMYVKKSEVNKTDSPEEIQMKLKSICHEDGDPYQVYMKSCMFTMLGIDPEANDDYTGDLVKINDENPVYILSGYNNKLLAEIKHRITGAEELDLNKVLRVIDLTNLLNAAINMASDGNFVQVTWS